MSSIDRPLAGGILKFRLEDERRRLDDPALLERHGRNGRTLAKEGVLRITLVAVARGGKIAPHKAEGPITVHCVDGTIRFLAGGATHELRAGEILSVPAGTEHAVESPAGGTFLLTVVEPA